MGSGIGRWPERSRGGSRLPVQTQQLREKPADQHQKLDLRNDVHLHGSKAIVLGSTKKEEDREQVDDGREDSQRGDTGEDTHGRAPEMEPSPLGKTPMGGNEDGRYAGKVDALMRGESDESYPACQRGTRIGCLARARCRLARPAVGLADAIDHCPAPLLDLLRIFELGIVLHRPLAHEGLVVLGQLAFGLGLLTLHATQPIACLRDRYIVPPRWHGRLGEPDLSLALPHDGDHVVDAAHRRWDSTNLETQHLRPWMPEHPVQVALERERIQSGDLAVLRLAGRDELRFVLRAVAQGDFPGSRIAG
ncbi:hypothetical protein CBM2597_P30037 [Cupriavidus taiwanensis]|nr:hypothetical protein CBM2597_P30037 [Cupriavidus taiwanensis]